MNHQDSFRVILYNILVTIPAMVALKSLDSFSEVLNQTWLMLTRPFLAVLTNHNLPFKKLFTSELNSSA